MFGLLSDVCIHRASRRASCPLSVGLRHFNASVRFFSRAYVRYMCPMCSRPGQCIKQRISKYEVYNKLEFPVVFLCNY